MDTYLMTDAAICREIGSRLKALRLRKNLTQQQLATAAAVSLNVIKRLENGRGKLSSLVAVLRELDALDSLEQFIPAPEVSPLQLAKRQGKQRQRATGKRGRAGSGETPEW
jgi:putative transcriptional regulator